MVSRFDSLKKACQVAGLICAFIGLSAGVAAIVTHNEALAVIAVIFDGEALVLAVCDYITS